MNNNAEQQNLYEYFSKYYVQYKQSHENVFVMHLQILAPWKFQGLQLKGELECMDAKLYDDIRALLDNGSITNDELKKHSVIQDAVNGRIEDRIKYFELATILLAIMATYIGLVKDIPIMWQVIYGAIVAIAGSLALIARINMMELLAANKTFNIVVKSLIKSRMS